MKLLAAAALFLLPLAPHAQKLSAAPAAPGMPPVPVTLDDRRKALADLVRDFQEDLLKHNPEFASALGDTRYNDQVSDYSARAFNDELAREQSYLLRIAVIDPTGLTGEEKQRLDLLEQRFEDDQKQADAKPWQTPVNATGSFYAFYPQLAGLLRFATAKDYDDWTARLRALPEAFAQATQAMELGIDDNHLPSKDVVQKAVDQVSALAHQKPEDSPLAAPLKQFPPTIGAPEQQRIKDEMLDAIDKEVLPAFLRFERFLRVSYLPAASAQPAAGAQPQGTRGAQLLAQVLDLRAQAQKTLGPKFDLEAFHHQVLDAALLSPDAFESRIAAWLAAGAK